MGLQKLSFKSLVTAIYLSMLPHKKSPIPHLVGPHMVFYIAYIAPVLYRNTPTLGHMCKSHIL